MPLLLLLLLLLLAAAPLLLLHAQVATGGSSPSQPVFNSGYVSSWSYLGTFEDERAEFQGQPSPLAREGAAYGDEGEEFAFLVGGVANLRGGGSASPTALGDVWLLDLTTDVFSSCGPLPSGATLYYAQGEWYEALEQLIVYGGVSSNGGPSTPELYFPGFYTIQFPSPVSCPGVQITSTAITPAQPGRKYHSIEIIDGALYVFGGYNAVTPLTQAQLFFTVSLSTGAATLLNTNSAYFPVGIIEPAILEDEGEHILFFYSGLSAPAGQPSSVFPPAGTLYRFDWERDVWLVPVLPMLGSSSESLLQYPQLVYSCHTHTLDDEHWFFAGGQDGFNNSLHTMVHFDMSTDSTVGVPTVTVLYAEIEVGLEHCAIALGLGELVVYTGYSQGVFSTAGLAYPAGIYEGLLPFLSPSATPDVYSSFVTPEDATAEWASTGLPPQREGAAYGCDGTTVYFAGGAVISAENVLALRDVWSANAPGDYYTSYSTQLPGVTYFGTSVWYNSALFVWGGRTNTVGSGSLNTYNSALYKVDFALSPPVASTVTLSGQLALQGTQHASSVVLNGRMYVWGGTLGGTGTSTPPSQQQWWSVNLATGQAGAESQSCLPECDYPSSVWVNPVLFTSSAGRYIYLYSGLLSDYAAWNNPFDVFIYDTAASLWLVDVEPLVGAYSALTPQFPNMAFGAKTVSSDGNHVIIVGGTWGDTSPNGAGSHTRLFHIDVTPMLSNGSHGRPLISILPTQLPTPIESSVAGLCQQDRELIVFSGARYVNSELAYPVSYSPLLLEVQQAGLSTPWVTPTATCSSASGSSGLSGGQVAGIVVGSILGTALIVSLILYLALGGSSMRKAGGGGAFGSAGGAHGYASHVDMSSEMSSRA